MITKPPSAVLLEDQPKPSHLVVVVRPEIGFLPEEIHQKLGKKREIFDYGRFDASQFVHARLDHGKRGTFLKANFPRRYCSNPSRRTASLPVSRSIRPTNFAASIQSAGRIVRSPRKIFGIRSGSAS